MAKLTFAGQKPGSYFNDEALENVVNYATHSQGSDNFLCYGSTTLVGSPNDMIDQMTAIQDLYRTDDNIGRRVEHGILIPDDQKGLQYTEEDLRNLGFMCSNFYYGMGFQSFFSLFVMLPDYYKIELVINPVDFRNGRKFVQSKEDVAGTEDIFSACLEAIVNERKAREKK